MKNNNQYTSSTLLSGAGSLMALSGILMALCGRIAIGGIFWAAAACMFFAAYNFRLAEKKKESDGHDNE